MSNIKFIGEGPDKGKIHIDNGNGTTGCGAVYSDNRKDWIATSERVTCEKNGCKGK